MDENTRELISRDEAARRAGVSVRTVGRWVFQGRLTKYTDGLGHVRIDAAELRELTTPQPARTAVR